MKRWLVFASVLLTLTSLWAAARSAQAQPRNPEEVCACISRWQQSVLQQEKLKTCQEVHGANCLGFEVRVTKPWTLDAKRKLCVGSYEYWESHKGFQPPWKLAGRYQDMTVSLGQALKRCRLAQGKQAPSRKLGIMPSPQDKAFAMLQDFLSQQPTLDEQVKKIFRTNAFIIAQDRNGRPYVVDNQGRKRDLRQWLNEILVLSEQRHPQRLSRGGFILLADQEIAGQVMGSLDMGLSPSGKTAYIFRDDPAYARKQAQALDRFWNRGYVLVQAEAVDRSLPGADYYQATLTLPGAGLNWDVKMLGTISGTINGGGDFIRLEWPPPTLWPWLLPRPAWAQPPAGTRPLILKLPLASATTTPDFQGRVELGWSGVSALAALQGQARIREQTTSREQSLEAGTMVWVFPGTGLSRPLPIPPKLWRGLRASQEAMRKAILGAARRSGGAPRR